DFVIIDNEAGMEHLSRRTTNKVDVLCITAESSPIGALTAKRIFELAKELPIDVKRIGVVWNRTENPKQMDGIDTLGCVPYDQALFEASLQGKNIFDLEQDNPALSAVHKILEKLNILRTS
ncbi:MAG: ATP-binding protein, partial [Planctomycetota bacterium]